MTEINNNIPNFGRNIEKIDNSSHKENKSAEIVSKTNPEQPEYIQDTGVLGRSQIRRTKAADCSKSADEAVRLAKEQPAVLYGCESIFESLYKSFIDSGMEPSEAYIKALSGEQEFMDIVKV